ncbi:MAG: hypothetical protein KIT83_05105 [Bryobacterales bacterium]|nr:hypothetical protein [Bryobacterales bacterium]
MDDVLFGIVGSFGVGAAYLKTIDADTGEITGIGQAILNAEPVGHCVIGLHWNDHRKSAI